MRTSRGFLGVSLPTRAPGFGATNYFVPVSGATKLHHCFGPGLTQIAPHFNFSHQGQCLQSKWPHRQQRKNGGRPCWPKAPRLSENVHWKQSGGLLCLRPHCSKGDHCHQRWGQCFTGSQWDEMNNVLLPSSQHFVLLRNTPSPYVGFCVLCIWCQPRVT